MARVRRAGRTADHQALARQDDPVVLAHHAIIGRKTEALQHMVHRPFEVVCSGTLVVAPEKQAKGGFELAIGQRLFLRSIAKRRNDDNYGHQLAIPCRRIDAPLNV